MAYRDRREATLARLATLEDERSDVDARISELELLLEERRRLDRELRGVREALRDKAPALAPGSSSPPRPPRPPRVPRRWPGVVLAGLGLLALGVTVVGAESEPVPEPPVAPCPKPAEPAKPGTAAPGLNAGANASLGLRSWLRRAHDSGPGVPARAGAR